MIRDVVADANESFVSYWERISGDHSGGASRTFGEIPVVSTGTPLPVFNRVYVFEPPDREDVSRAVSWIADQEVPFRVTVAESALAATEPIVSDLGLVVADDPLPGMALTSLDGIPASDGDLDIELVTDAEGHEAYVDVASAGFGIPVDITRRLVPEAPTTDEEMQLLLGRVGGEPVATGNLFQQGDVTGVYAIAVTEAFRRRGSGKAMTWAVLRAGREAGGEIGVLQSSSMGYPVYERMGFETVVEYHQFHPA